MDPLMDTLYGFARLALFPGLPIAAITLALYWLDKRQI